MERDFMGLNSKDAVVLIKEEAIEGPQEPDHFEAFNNRHSGEIQKSIGHNTSSGTRVQLTIFYGGIVNVYDDVSPEKAQAIMLLAGNGARAETQVPTTRTPADVVYVSQPTNTPPLSSPVAVGQATGGGSTMAKDAPRGMSSLGQVMQSAVPQAPKASLARFLEKRKERVMASAPYSLGKSSLGSTGNLGSSSVMSEDDKQCLFNDISLNDDDCIVV